jgi:putative oxidoreductase
LQRLFTMFPRGWPGAGLFLLRLAAGIPLIIAANLELRGAAPSPLYAVQFVAIGVGILLLAGLWTPIAGVLQVVIELWIVFSRGEIMGLHVLVATLGISLVMLGPGALSVDARLFGRKRINIRSR